MALSTTRTLLTQTGINTHQVFDIGGLDSVGVATFSNFKTGLSNLHSTGLTVGDTFLHSTGVNLGAGATVSNNGNATFSGIITATSFVGDISQATGAAAGLGTALSQTQTDPLNKVYYTNKVLSISTTTTIDHPATANLAYTQYGDIKIEDGHDLVIKTDDDFKYDILGISTTKLADNYFQNGLTIGIGSSVKGNLIGNVTGNVTGNINNSSNLLLQTDGSERLRIDSSGRLLLGQTSAYGTNQMMIINGASHAGNAYNGQLMIQGSETNGSSTTGGRINFAGHDGNTARTWANITGAKENGTAGDTSAYLSFDTRPSGGNPTERLRIASDGTVSIGQAGYTQGGAAPLLSLYGSTGRAFKIMNSGSQTSGMQMQNSTTGYGEDAGIHFACLSGGSAYLVNQTNNVDFMVMYSKVSGSTKHIMQIYNDGKIGHQTNSDNLMLSNSQDGSGSNYFLRGSKNSTTPGGGNDCVWIYEDGDLRNNNNSYGQQSDIKLKENVVDAGSQWDDIKNLKVRKFNFKASTGFDTHTQIGLIAQEAELVSPGLVKEVKDRVKIEEVSEVDGSTSYKESLSETEKTKHVMYSVLYMKAIKALQEAMTRIETLEQDNIALRARVTNLEGN